jgi:hypothetical protein
VEPQKRWYGWQILIGLAISHTLIGLGAVAVAAEAPELGVTLIVTGSTGHVFMGPITHWVHGYGAKGWAAVGINVGVPISISATAFANGYAADPDCRGDFCGLGTLLVSVLAGWVAVGIAPAIDIATLAYHKGPETPPAPGPKITGVVPMLGDKKTGLSIVGQF